MPELCISKLFQTCEESSRIEEVHINGNVPEYVHGKFLRVGPGKFDFPNFKMQHWLDGYSILSQFDIVNGSIVKFQKKYLQSDSYKKALVAQKPVLCEFGTPKMSNDLTKGAFSRVISNLVPIYELTDNDQLNLFQLGSDTFVSSETCNFREICPDSLKTGEKHDTWRLFGLNICSAHPITDKSGITYNIGVTVLSGLKYHIVAIPGPICPTGRQETGKELMKNSKIICTIPSSYGFEKMSYVHSIGMSKNYIIFIEQPYCILVSKAIKSLMKSFSFKDWLDWKPELKNRFYLIEKETGKIVKTEYVGLSSFFFLHFVNCYEESNQVVVDITAYPDPSAIDNMYLNKLRAGIFDEGKQPCAQRFVLPLVSSDLNELPENINLVEIKSDATAKRVKNRIILTPEIMTESGFEFATINKKHQGKKYGHFWATGSAAPGYFEHSLCKVDTLKKETTLWPDKKSPREYYCPGEPQFISKPNGLEDEGVLISAVSDIKPGANDFLIFLDAKSMNELGRAQFKSHLPQALHGLWIPNSKS